jgi:hypothetical protein
MLVLTRAASQKPAFFMSAHHGSSELLLQSKIIYHCASQQTLPYHPLHPYYTAISSSFIHPIN